MKLFKILLMGAICIFLISCQNENSVSSSNLDKHALNKPAAIIVGGFFGDDINPSLFPQIYSYGWRAIDLHEENGEHNNGIAFQTYWNSAAQGGYSPKFAQINRELIEGPYGGVDMNHVNQIINLAYSNGARFIFIDDFLTGWATDQRIEREIDQNIIDKICDSAHSKGMDVAVSEDCYSVYIIGHIWNKWSLYNKIDVVMPYGYVDIVNHVSMYNHLFNFYSDLRNHTKRVIPILGYRTTLGADQLGVLSGGIGFIERALQFTENKIIFFWIKNPARDLGNLTEYLQEWGYIIGTPIL